jgi:hypothetical protein
LLTASKYAFAPIAAVENVDEATPVTDVTKPILIAVGVTPGALALLPPLAPVGWPPPEAFLDDPPHAAATSPTARSKATARLLLVLSMS